MIRRSSGLLGGMPFPEPLVQIGQSLYPLVDFDLEEGGGRVALQLGAVQVQAALVEEEVGSRGR